MPLPVLRRLSLRTRILAVAVGTVLLLGTTTTFFVRDVFERALLGKLESRGQAIARHLAASAVSPLLTEKYLQLDLLLRESREAEEAIEYVFILSPRGEVLSHTFDQGFPTALKNAGAGGGVLRLSTERGEVLDVSAPVLRGDLGTLHLGMSEGAVRKETRTAVGGVLWIGFACTAAAAALATLLSLAITEPLDALAKAADEMRAGRFPDAVPVGSSDEVGRLASTFNAMVAARREAEGNQARLIAELKEALANVRLLQGLLPICASCKRIRDDKGYWSQIESYISTHADVQFSHGLCPECLRSQYPEYAARVEERLAGGRDPGDAR